MTTTLDFLRALTAECGGCVPVERFMQEALYHPKIGYYAKRVQTVGREGDFSTSATLSPALGEAIAAWANHHRPAVTSRGKWHLIELGGGSGQLATSILGALGWCRRFGLTYHLVEVSAGLRADQEQRLKNHQRVRWHTEVESALAAAHGQALIFSNEFTDAFPCVQLAWNEPFARWDQVCVAWDENTAEPTERLLPWTPANPVETASALDPTQFQPPRDGQRIELHFAYRHWLETCAAHLRRGRLLTIDYGDRLPMLYHRQPRGTLRGYCRHQRFEGLEIYHRFGQQDLTADVNFTDLERWGTHCGLDATIFQTQSDFLRRWLPRRLLFNIESDPALEYLLDASGPGGAFKVLEQVKQPLQRFSK